MTVRRNRWSLRRSPPASRGIAARGIAGRGIAAPRSIAAASPVVAAGVVAVALLASGCSAIGGATPGYRMTAVFPKTIAFYNHSKVKLMGVNVGEINSITITANAVRVGFTVDKGVPLPSDVHAEIFPESVIGERNLTLFPAWTPGHSLAHAGDTIPESRTQVPVEIDDVLKSVTELANAVNPTDVRNLVIGADATLKGHGNDLGAAIDQATTLSGILADQDQQLVATAANIHQLAQTLDDHQQQLGQTIDAFAQTTGVLASERQQLSSFLSAIVSLSQNGQAVITGLQQQLPTDLADLAKLTLTVQANASGLAQFLSAIPGMATIIIEAYTPTYDLFRFQFDVPASSRPILYCALSSLPALATALQNFAPGTRCP